MDFLDPSKRSSRRFRLVLSYSLMTLLIIISTAIVLGSSFGYGFNTKTGEIVQNGLVFVDSAPTKAEVILNGQDSGKSTSAHALFPGPVRLELASGKYTLTLKQAGYRTWTDQFNLDSQDVLRFEYPLLFPTKLTPVPLTTFTTRPSFMAQTPDSNWLEAAEPTSTGIDFWQYGTTASSLTPTKLSLAASLENFNGGQWQAVGWSNDSTKLLLSHISGNKREFIVFNRTNPSQSYNLSRLANLTLAKAVFRSSDGSSFWLRQTNGRLYQFNQSSQQLSLIDTSTTDFTASQTQLMYLTASNAPAGQWLVKIWDGSQSYTLGNLKAGSPGLLAIGTYAGNNYFVFGSAVQSVAIFKNPLNSLRASQMAVPLASLGQKDTTSLSFSENNHFLSAQTGSKFEVYDFYRQNQYTYQLHQALANPASWLDEYHFGDVTPAGLAYIWDYDGANAQPLVASTSFGGFALSSDYHRLYSLAPVKSSAAQLTLTTL